jgi:hypothetical protein
MRQSISAEGLSALVAAGAAYDVRAIPGPDGHGWQLQVRYSKESRHFPLRSRREVVRVFQSLDTLNGYAQGIEIRGFWVES